MKTLYSAILLLSFATFSAKAQPLSAYRFKVSTVFKNNVFKDGPDSVAQFQSPARMVTLGDSVLLVADMNNNRIRRVSIATKTTSTIAGNGASARLDGIGTEASLNRPKDLVLIGDTVVYFTEEGSASVRKLVLATGIVTTIAGGVSGFANGPGATARFNTPQGITNLGDSVLFIADNGNNRIRKIQLKGEFPVTTFAGTGSNNYIAKDSLHKDSINIGNPRGVLVVGNNLAFVENDYNHPVLRYIRFSDNIVYNFGGQDRPQDLILLNGDTVLITSDGGGGNLLEKVLSNPTYFRNLASFQADGVAKIGNTVYLIQPASAQISSLQYKPSTAVTRFTGIGRTADGSPDKARFGTLGNFAKKGNWIYYDDASTYRIRRFNIVSQETQTLTRGGRGDNANLAKVSLAQARFNTISDMAFGPDGRLFILDRGNNQIRILDEAKDSVYLFAGNRTAGYTNGGLLQARFGNLTSLTFLNNKMFLTEMGSGARLRSIDLTSGEVSTLSGPAPGITTGLNGTKDSTGAESRFGNNLSGLFSRNDTLFVTDASNRRFRNINPNTGQVTTWAASNLFDNLVFGFVDKTGSIISRYNGARNDIAYMVNKVGPWPVIMGANGAGNVDGLGTVARFSDAATPVLDSATGDVYVPDRGNQSFRKIEYILFNQAPTVTGPTPANYTVSTTDPVSVSNFVTITPGPAWESAQTLTPYSITSSNNGIFSVNPTVSGNGTLAFTANGTNGVSNVKVCFRDNGGIENGGTDSTCYSFTITASFTGNRSLVQKSNALVFPNPSNDGQIYFSMANGEKPLMVEVLDVTGRVVSSTTNPGASGSISLKSKGLYLLRFQFQDGQTETRKIENR